jgi:hypothetical protein
VQIQQTTKIDQNVRGSEATQYCFAQQQFGLQTAANCMFVFGFSGNKQRERVRETRFEEHEG